MLKVLMMPAWGDALFALMAGGNLVLFIANSEWAAVAWVAIAVAHYATVRSQQSHLRSMERIANGAFRMVDFLRKHIEGNRQPAIIKEGNVDKIRTVFVFICEEADGGEGVPAFSHGPMMMPLIGADPARVDSLRQKAQEICDATGTMMTLAQFTVRQDLEVIAPRVKT